MTLFQICLVPVSFSQTLTNAAASAKVKDAELVVVDTQRKNISFVRLKSTSNVPVSQSGSWLRSAYDIPLSTELRKVKQDEDKLGYIHSKYQQYIHGFPVEWSTLNVHSYHDKIVSSNAECYDNISVPASATLSEAAAMKKALDYFKAPLIGNTDDLKKPELLILPISGGYQLAYKFDLYSHTPLKRSYVYVSAATGEILLELNRIHTGNATGMAVTRYNGTRTITTDSVNATTYRLRESARGNGFQTWNLNNTTHYGTAVDFTDADNLWNTTVNFDDAAYDAHFGSEATYDYFWNTYGRNSIDNAGFPINNYVHYSSGYVNAFWDGASMTYGDGDGVDNFPLTCLDIVGHEITHGLTENTAGLIYSGESGALNESFSDIFGITIDFYTNPATANWLEGDQINVNGIPFRSMEDPNLYDCPDTYGGLFWNNGDIVHYNSSVMNYWYYLLCNGGSGLNDIGSSFLINGIGMADAAAIAYRNLTVYLTPNSTFADARAYAIQSATDLFGNCSTQLIQTTNAWYAVGVGGLFSNAVVAGFNVPKNLYCTIPATVHFSNTSINSSSYKWYFGDGDSSSAASPNHAYATQGNYSVTLIANGTATCASTDTLIQTNLISVTNGVGPVDAACTPATHSYCCNAGITHVIFGTVNNSTANAVDGYRDYTCSQSTTWAAGDALAFFAITSSTINENLKAYIDYDNNGQFNNANELVFSSDNKLQNHFGFIYTPVTATLNTPLRFRIMSDTYSHPINSSCTNLQNGQAEDYAITFTENTLPPIANFSADGIVNVGDTVRFYDASLHVPTSWLWNFNGGSITSSTLRTPYTIYHTTGTYTVKLFVSNAFGSDSLVQVAYIKVVNKYNMCKSTASSSLVGVLYDSGGPLAIYQDGENCSFLIQPPCADTITLSFIDVITESCCDSLYVYDGTTTASPLLVSLSGISTHAPVKATSGAMLINFRTDASNEASGFTLEWVTKQYPIAPPVANFNISDNTPPLGVSVQFTDVSTNSPNAWLWDFGDGYTSAEKNPIHVYTSPGTHNVQLIAITCIASDTISKSVLVQGAPTYSITPDSIHVSVSCGDSIRVPVRIVNSGTGDLVVNARLNGEQNTRLQVLALQYGTDLTEEYPNTLSAINQYFTQYNLTTINTISATALQTALVGKDVFLVTEPETGSASVYGGFASVLQDFVSNGGTVILCGTYNSQSPCIFNTGLFSGDFDINAMGQALTIINPVHPLLEGVTPPLIATNGTYILNITNPDKVSLIEYNGHDALTYREIGLGRAIYIAFDYFDYSFNTRNIVSNAVKWAQAFMVPSWVHTAPDSVYCAAGDTATVYFTLSSAGLNTGTYEYDLIIATNDPLHLFDTIPVSMTIGGTLIPASCSPVTTSYCCDRGITQVQFNTINNTSSNGISGYQDFTCTHSTTVMEGMIYPISITTGPDYNETVKVWLDFDNNGIFSANELALTSSNQLLSHSGNIVIPVSAVHNVSLRMRIMSEYASSPAPQSCTALEYGQCEDYTVVVASAPVASFSYQANACSGLIAFTDSSLGPPTSWRWNFGDGNTDTIRNPVHQYTSAGLYAVQLIACNVIACDTVIYNIQVAQLVPGFTWTGSLVAGQSISFSSTAAGANYWLWDFGDGDLDSASSLAHTYGQAGIYAVTLFVSNASGCFGSYSDTLVILPVGLDELKLVSAISLFPNPFRDETVLKYRLMKEATVSINLVNVLGQHVKTIYSTGRQETGEKVYAVTVHSPGVYYLELVIDGQRLIRKLIKTE